MPQSTYELVTNQVTVADTSSTIQTFTLTAPTGKKPLAGGYHTTNPNIGGQVVRLDGSYPSGQDWVFEFHPAGVFGGLTVDLYLICATI